MAQIAILNRVNISEHDGLECCKCSILPTHFVFLTTSEGSQDVRHVVNVKFAFLSKLISASFDSPEDILVLASAQDVKGLGKPRQLLWISLLSSFAKVVLVVGYELLDRFLIVPPVGACVLGPA